MKTIITIIAFSFLSNISFGQKLKINSGKFKMDELIKGPFVVRESGDKEFDDAVKFAFEKYWKLSPLKFTPYKENPSYKDVANFKVSSWKGRSGGKYTYSHCSFWTPDINTQMNFDDFKKGDSDDGIDKDFHKMAIKVIPFIMCWSAEVNRVNTLGNTKWGGMTYNKRESIKHKVKDYTILIQKENVDTKRLSDAPFKQYLKKYEFVSSDDINTRIKEQKNTENTALLVFGRDDYLMTLSIIDIKTGDLLYYNEDGLGTFTQGKSFTDEVIGKLLKKLDEPEKK